MNRLIVWLMLLLVTTIVACSHIQSDVHLAPIALSPSTLNADPDRYDGQRIVVNGFVRLGTNSHHLYESEELAQEFSRRLFADPEFQPRSFDKYCLTIANPDRLYEDARRYHEKTVELRGVFVKQHKAEQVIDLGACELPTAIIID